MTSYKKKLIEVALPLEAINKASAREKSIRHGHPSMLHLWWARRPLAAARAVIFAQMVDDPSAHPEQFPTAEAQEAERQRLFRLIEELVQWENTTNEEVLNRAREEIWKSWRTTCAANRDHPQAEELFNPEKLPAFHDPFAGGGTLPLEAQRLGLEAYASDLNPVAVLINKAMIEIPPKFAGMPPVNPEAQKEQRLFAKTWRGAEGLAEDVRYYGQWMRDEAEKRIGHLYPKMEITAEMAQERPDLKQYVGQKLTVIAWLWARTVKSPNPAFAHVDVPLASTFMLSTKTGKEAYIEPVIKGDHYWFTVRTGIPKDEEATKNGTSAGKRKAFKCLISKVPISYDYIRNEAKAGRMNTRLMGIVAEGKSGRVYISPVSEHEIVSSRLQPTYRPDIEMPKKHRNFQPPVYGMNSLGDLFTSRQLVALNTFSELVLETRKQIHEEAIAVRLIRNINELEDGRDGTIAYADAIATYLGITTSRLSNTINAFVIWSTSREQSVNLFSRQAIPMAWDFPEVNPFAGAAGDFGLSANSVSKSLENVPASGKGTVFQQDAKNVVVENRVISTDPPYYDNINYADLSDFFYTWLRRSLRVIFTDLFTTIAVPKAEELVATPYRHGNKEKADAFFLEGMTNAMKRLSEQTHPSFPVTIYYAFKQAETENEDTVSTGWETFLDAVIRAGFSLTGTWPIRTERPTGVKVNFNALASSVILVCRPCSANASKVTRRDFINALRSELPSALNHLQRGNIAPVDLAQAAIGPGMEIYTRYAQVLDASGKPLSVREALALINETLDEVLAEQEGDFDADTRWALAWFEQFGFNDGPFGDAETLSKAKNTAINGLEQAGIVLTKAGRVRLLRPADLPAHWNPASDKRLTVWEMVHQLVRVLEEGGEQAAAELVTALGSKTDIARELAYRLYTICERKKRAQEALSYNGLVQSWPEIIRLAQESNQAQLRQGQLI